jgi:acetolactate synthase small subunit
MYALGHPVYSKLKTVLAKDILSRYYNDPLSLVYSYIIIKGTYVFPFDVKFPSIPEYLDGNTTVYPLKGNCILTGAEYVTAMNQGCKIKITKCIEIPFESRVLGSKSDVYVPKEFDMIIGGKAFVNHPFAKVISDIQKIRREHPKGSFQNTMAKLLGNSMYGLVVQGMSHKTHYDIKTDSVKRTEGSKFTNPLMASWITAMVRSIIGELLHITSLLGGRIVSVTTDGFVTDLSDLENRILKYIEKMKKEVKKVKKVKKGNKEKENNHEKLYLIEIVRG